MAYSVKTPRFLLLICMGILILLAACDNAQPQGELPTLIPSATTDQSTPVPATATSTAPTATQRSNELPPTWTFTPEPTEIPILPSATQPTAIFPVASPNTLCDNFVVDLQQTQRDFTIGGSPIVAWTPVAGTLNYRLTLVDDEGTLLFETYIAETSFQFRSDLFTLGTRYGWEVFPLDTQRVQSCFAIGGELVPARATS